MNKLIIRVVVFITLIILCLGLGVVWWFDATSAVNTADTSSKIFVVGEGESVRTIATRLKNAGIIKDQIGFFLLVKLMRLENILQAGDFRLSPAMSAREVASELTHGTLDVWVTTLEGWRVEEMALKLAQELAIPESEFLKVAREGYMFPDTYLVPKDASAASISALFAENFEDKVTPEIRAGIENQNLTLEEGVVLASIVEREGRTDTDRPVIAGILLNRLRDGHPLQADATLQYVLGYQNTDKTWWKKSLYDEDKKIRSPYNTYLNNGLPPAPISNPGLAAIRAVAFPEDTDYYYYIHDPEGAVHFAETLAEHNANVSKYLR